MGRIADTLSEAGHDVTSLEPIIDPSIQDGSSKSKTVHVERSASTASMYDTFTQLKSNFFNVNNCLPMSSYNKGKFFGGVFSSQCRATLEEAELLEQLKEEHFDVMISEHFDMCGVELVGLLKPKAFISVSTGPAFSSIQQEEFGISPSPSYDPGEIIVLNKVVKINKWNKFNLGFVPTISVG